MNVTGSWQKRRWRVRRDGDVGESYPFVKNRPRALLTGSARLTNAKPALISFGWGLHRGTDPFDISAADGDFTFREIPIEIQPDELRFAARGYDPTAVLKDQTIHTPTEQAV